MAIEIEIDVIGGKTLLVTATKALPGALTTSVKQVGALLAGYMGEEAPVDKGRLAGSMAFRMIAQLEGRATAGGTNVEYAPDVAFGTKPHIIRPKNGKALAFSPVAAMTIGGRQNQYRSGKSGKLVKSAKAGMIFRKEVHHPGTKANPFHERAMDRTMPEIPLVVERALMAAGVL